MRVTLDIDEDVLNAARQLALVQRTSAGRVLSQLVRKVLRSTGTPWIRNGVPLLPPRPESAVRPTINQVNRLRDDA